MNKYAVVLAVVGLLVLNLATGNGLYFSSNRGRNWNRLFKGKSYFENECTALAIYMLRSYYKSLAILKWE